MKLSEIQAILTKAATLLGDAPVILQHAETQAVTDIHGLQVLINDATQAEGGIITLVHGATAAAVVDQPAQQSQPADPNA